MRSEGKAVRRTRHGGGQEGAESCDGVEVVKVKRRPKKATRDMFTNRKQLICRYSTISIYKITGA